MNGILSAETPRSRRDELRAFLRTRRAALSPADVGLVANGRRRTPGLRREEVAVLANVGVSWYTWLEQGKDIKVSTRVLDSICQALRLTESERVHLYHLAGMNPPSPRSGPRSPAVPQLARLTDGWSPNPAFVLDRQWDVVAANRTARWTFDLQGDHYNCLIAFFTQPNVRARYPAEEELGRGLVAQLRAQAAQCLGDPGFASLVARLSAGSKWFAELWDLHEIVAAAQSTLYFRHPVVGDLFFEHTTLNVASHDDYRLLLYTPEPSTDTAERLAWLARRIDG